MKSIVFLGLLTACLESLAGAKFPPPQPETVADDLFVQESIPHLRLELSQAAMARLRQSPRAYVAGTIREGATIYTNVAIRLKGGPGSFRNLDDGKPAFTINFARAVPGQKFHGLKKIHLNNSVQDGSFLGEKISRELFLAAGVPAPRAGHATVQLNGETLGFYVLIEGIDKQFLKRHFKNPDGNLYDGHSQSEVTRPMRMNAGRDVEARKKLALLAAAAQEPDLEARAERLEKVLDVDRFISFLATEIMICHWDGYALNRNNFRIYDDLANGRFVFLPQGADQVFQRPNNTLYPQMPGLVARSVMEVPQFRERYRQRMTQLLTNVYSVSAIKEHLNEVAAKMQPRLAEIDPQAAANHARKLREFESRIQQRVRLLERQLLSRTQETAFDPAGTLRLSGWQGQVDIGSPKLNLDQSSTNQPVLQIEAEGPSAGSWRTHITLNRGTYRFVGKIRLEKVELESEDAKAGAGLRVSRHKFGRALAGDMAWTPVSYAFDVAQDQTDVELVCELRAKSGRASFDVNSLRLTRIAEKAE